MADRAFGDPRRGHPVAGLGRAALALERVLWRPRRWAGLVYVTTVVGATGVAAASVARTLRRWPFAPAALTSLVVFISLGGRSLEQAALRLAAAVESGDLALARSLLAALAGRDPAGLDAGELCRAGIESVAENTADAVTGPLFWCAIGGPAAAAAYRAANTLDAMVGYRNERYETFGWAAARLDDIATWPAARLAAGLAVLLAPVVGGDRRAAWSTVRRDGASHPSPNAGQLEATFAGALGVRLGGVNVYDGRVEARPSLGDGREPGPEDLRRAVALCRVTGLASAVVCAGLAWSICRLQGGKVTTPRRH